MWRLSLKSANSKHINFIFLFDLILSLETKSLKKSCFLIFWHKKRPDTLYQTYAYNMAKMNHFNTMHTFCTPLHTLIRISHLSIININLNFFFLVEQINHILLFFFSCMQNRLTLEAKKDYLKLYSN